LNTLHDAAFLTPVQEVAQEIQDGVTGAIADWIKESQQPPRRLQQLGWGRREVVVDVEGVPRKIDIGDVLTRPGVE
jgi:hypothetical protein